MKNSTVFNRSVFALGLSCALASLPMSVRAQDVPASNPAPTEAADTNKAEPDAAPATDTAAKPATDATATKPATGQKLSAGDQAIARKLAGVNQAEIDLGQLASTNGESTQVKEYAQKMVDEHTKANEELTGIATEHGFDLKPEAPQAEKAMQTKMKSLKGAEFDRMYVKHATMDHSKAIKSFEADEKKIQDKALLAYAQKTLPTIKEHEKMAQELKGAVPESSEGKGAKKKKAK